MSIKAYFISVKSKYYIQTLLPEIKKQKNKTKTHTEKTSGLSRGGKSHAGNTDMDCVRKETKMIDLQNSQTPKVKK